MDTIDVIIFDSYKMNRDIWDFVLSRDARFAVRAVCTNAQEIIVRIKEKPGIILMGINSGTPAGLDQIQAILKHGAKAKIIIISYSDLTVFIKKILQLGAKGYITKSSPLAEIGTAITEVNGGKTYICEEVKNIVALQALTGRATRDSDFGMLTNREMEIVEHIRGGENSNQIAEKLLISKRTVQVHRYNILQKLNFKNTASLVNYFNSREGPGLSI